MATLNHSSISTRTSHATALRASIRGILSAIKSSEIFEIVPLLHLNMHSLLTSATRVCRPRARSDSNLLSLSLRRVLYSDADNEAADSLIPRYNHLLNFLFFLNKKTSRPLFDFTVMSPQRQGVDVDLIWALSEFVSPTSIHNVHRLSRRDQITDTLHIRPMTVSALFKYKALRILLGCVQLTYFPNEKKYRSFSFPTR